MQSVLADGVGTLAVAVSGGADSLALCLLVQAWAKPHGITVHGIHIDHRLRPESGDEAMQVQAWLAAHGIDCDILAITDDLRGSGNLPANARAARYQLMTKWCAQHDIHHLCLGHHAQDQAETLLMRLGRGSGIDGLASMRSRTKRDGMTWLRPLLHTRRESLIAYLQERGQPWLEDSSNHNPAYQRNRLRTLLPTLEAEGLSPKRLCEVTDHLARAGDCLEELATEWIKARDCWRHEAFAYLPVNDMATLHEELALRVVRQILRALSPQKQELRFEALQPVVAAMQRTEHHGQTHSLHGCLVRRKGAYDYIGREPARLPAPQPMMPGRQVWDRRFRVDVTVPALTETLMLQPLGPEGLKRVRESTATLPEWPAVTFHTLPALFYLEAPLLVPHINYVRPDYTVQSIHCVFTPLTPDTELSAM